MKYALALTLALAAMSPAHADPVDNEQAIAIVSDMGDCVLSEIRHGKSPAKAVATCKAELTAQLQAQFAQ